MGAMAPPPHWVPEDDLLLKNAVEAGASLESLAKGAVQFTRRYTVQELQDRWLALLYDPVVSVDASDHMTEFELSGFANQSKPNKVECVKETACSSAKRKTETVRRCYYAMRKRICNDPFDLMGINLLADPANSNFGGDCNELSIGNPVSNDLGIQDPDFDIGDHQYFSEIGTHVVENHNSQALHYAYEEDIPLIGGDHNEVHGFDQSLFEAGGLDDEGNACTDFGGPSFSNFEPQNPIWSTSSQIEARNTNGAEGLPPQVEGIFAEISKTLFDFSTEDDLLFMDPHGKNTIDKSYYDGLTSLLLDSPNQTGVPSIDPGEAVVAAAADGELVAAHPVEHDNSGPQFCYPVLTPNFLGPEYRNGVICCTLNTEDPEIPSNDDVFLPFRHPSPSSSPGAHWRLEDPNYIVSSSSIARKTNGTMKNHQKNPSRQSDMGSKYLIGDHGVKYQLPKSNVQNAALRTARNNECKSNIGPANVSANNIGGGVVKMEGPENLDYGTCLDKSEHLDILQNLQTNARNGLDFKPEIVNNGSANVVDLSCQRTNVPHQTNEKSMPLDEEEWSENEFHVPYFSDVEAMILDMDLSPDEFNLNANPEVCRYSHEETKRTIIRLEQGADACTQRAIAAQGAFAVLYGRCSKYYIKKPEVLIGRATEDSTVDIDLGRERNGSKISRRQAIMKMDMYGKFQMKNLGRCSIFVNGKEVAAEQSIPLTSGCLIEVRGLSYLFETNHTRIKQHVDSAMDGRFLVDHKPSNIS